MENDERSAKAPMSAYRMLLFGGVALFGLTVGFFANRIYDSLNASKLDGADAQLQFAPSVDEEPSTMTLGQKLVSATRERLAKKEANGDANARVNTLTDDILAFLDQQEALSENPASTFDADEWLAANGDANAQYRLGRLYWVGKAEKQDTGKALFWLQKAAEQGHAKAQAMLGLIYSTEDGLEHSPPRAVFWYRKAAEQGDANAQFMLAWFYSNGTGITQDAVQAMYWCRKAAGQGLAAAQYMTSLYYAGGIGVSQDAVQSFFWGRKAAEQGDAEAQHRLGRNYATGYGVERDPTQAAAWYLKAAEQGYIDAKHELGMCLYQGIGVERDYSQAVFWFRKAAEQGHIKAQFFMSLFYADGIEVPKDPVQSVAWIRKAAEQGNAGSQLIMGVAYAQGEGVAQNHAQAVDWFLKAALQGNAEAQYCIGIAYALGQGVKENSAVAVQWYRRAADQGHVEAQYRLAASYYNGYGTAKNLPNAVLWYRRAAEQGHVDAQDMLGGGYYYGEGVIRDYAQAVKWFRKAADQGSSYAHYRLGLCYEAGKGVDRDLIQACVHFIVSSALGFTHATEGLDKLRNQGFPAAGYAVAQRTATEWLEAHRNKSRINYEQTSDPRNLRQKDTHLASGTGFIISADGYFLTCAHVVEGGNNIRVLLNANTYPARLVRADSRNDIALLKLEGAGFHPLAFASTLPGMGDRVFTVGFPNPDVQGAAAKYTEGVISSLSGIMDDIRTMQITVPIQGGNSGGALVDANGNVVGLVVAQLDAVTVFEYTGSIPQNVNFAIKINYALPLVQSISGLSSRLPRPRTPSASTRPVDIVQAASGLVVVYE